MLAVPASLVIGLVLLGIASSQGAWGGAPKSTTRTINPHWKAESCAECHAGSAENPRAIDPVAADALCLKCHNGKAASSELHPIGRPIPQRMTSPANWPMSTGRLGCLTCHNVKVACDRDAERTPNKRSMLRLAQKDGDKIPFCQACHSKEEFPRFNPHIMLAADTKTPIEERCLSCHAEVPSTGSGKRTGKALLRSEELLLCRACHTKHDDVFSPGHLGQRLKPDMLAFMRAREVVGLAVPPAKGLLAQLKSEKASPTLMHPSASGQVTCTTCHNPHQAGVFPSTTPLGYRGMRVIDNSKVVSPVRGDQWCNHCHDIN